MSDVLLNPGPVNVSDRVRAALVRGDVCHREPEVAATLAETRELLLDLFDPGHAFDAVFFTGSGTAAVEAVVSSTPAAGAKLLVIENGVYGERMTTMAERHGIETARLTSAWHERPDLERLDAMLRADRAIDTVALVHNETTTGLLNPVREVGEIVRRHDRVFLLDTVSGLAGETAELEDWGVDVAASTANKCIGGFPGISFAMVGHRVLESLRERGPARSLYLDLAFNHAAQAGGCGAFTPAVQILWALEAALAELADEGVAARIARFGRATALVREAAARLGLFLYLEPDLCSNTISSFRLPADVDYSELHARLKNRGFVIYAGQGPLAGEIFRVATMGSVSFTDYERFTGALAEVLGELRS
jgi:2-aminoethylphosphonate-pyruvate transaminase